MVQPRTHPPADLTVLGPPLGGDREVLMRCRRVSHDSAGAAINQGSNWEPPPYCHPVLGRTAPGTPLKRKPTNLARCRQYRGWAADLSELDLQVLSARALKISATVWAAWHATGHARCGDHARCILWLVGAGAT